MVKEKVVVVPMIFGILGTMIKMLYVDNMWPCARNDEEQVNLLTMLYMFTNDVWINISLDKCSIAMFIRCDLQAAASTKLHVDTIIKK